MKSRFDLLCEDFEKNKPSGPPKSRTFLVSIVWPSHLSINDVLIGFLKDHGCEYLRDFNGTVWFIFQDKWHNCVSEVSRDNKYISFYIVDYD